MLRDEWSIHRNAKATKMKKKRRTCVFRIKTNITREALCCARLQRPYVDVAAPTAHGTRIVGLREPTGADDARANDAHLLLSHMEIDATCAAAAHPSQKQTECEACKLE